jgi:hypothetical protein
LAERQAGFDLVAFVAQLVSQPPPGQDGRGHRVPDHHPGDRHQGPPGEREHMQAEQHAQGYNCRRGERCEGEAEQVRHFGSAAAGDHCGVAEHRDDP